MQIAFKDYKIGVSPWKMPWTSNHGMKYFIQAFSNRDFLYALRNTVVLNGLDLVIGFPIPIILAIVLNELRFPKFKKVTQTIAYMPHFLSWIIISGLAKQIFAPSTGLVNLLIMDLGGEPVPFLNDPHTWVGPMLVRRLAKCRLNSIT